MGPLQLKATNLHLYKTPTIMKAPYKYLEINTGLANNILNRGPG
jgi:hypothetical protein